MPLANTQAQVVFCLHFLHFACSLDKLIIIAKHFSKYFLLIFISFLRNNKCKQLRFFLSFSCFSSLEIFSSDTKETGLYVVRQNDEIRIERCC